MTEKKENDLFVYHTLMGSTLVGQELSRENGTREVLGLSTIEMDQSLTQMNFSPVRYANPKKPYRLFRTGLLGEQEMPEMFRQPFTEYLEDICK